LRLNILAKLLKDICGTPSGYEGPQLVIVEANIRSETPAQILEKVNAEIRGRQLKNIATFLKDREDGDLTSTTLDTMKKISGNLVDFKEQFDLCNSTKTASEIKNLETAANFTEWSFSRLVSEVEDMIEGDL
jgi:Xaa-Pro aminopeptidase